jgi:RNA polymerase sigma-70 factor, ECF subfamily
VNPREPNRPPDLTGLIATWKAGDRAAFDRLFQLVYGELRVLARRQLRRAGGGRTLVTTALIHEAYLKLAQRSAASVADRHHFFALAAKVMRHILVDHARGRAAKKRGAGANVTLSEEDCASIAQEPTDIIEIDRALTSLEKLDPRLGQIMELRFFGGLSVEETAEALSVSPRTVKRDWQKARAYLYRELSPNRDGAIP